MQNDKKSFAHKSNFICLYIGDKDDVLYSTGFAPLSELAFEASNSASILHTVGAVHVRVCESTTGYMFTLAGICFTTPSIDTR